MTLNVKDNDGNYRQLHTEKAAECIDYNVEDDIAQSINLVRTKE